MIESIEVKDVATYCALPQRLTSLAKVNFVYGANGSGKTTISRVIADESRFPACSINWKGSTKLQTMVYNQDFIEKNFNQLAELKGIFTLGEKQTENQGKIADAKEKTASLNRDIEALKTTLSGADGKAGKIAELAELDAELKEKCWQQKQRHDAKLQDAFKGFRNDSQKFKEKVLAEKDANKSTLLSLNELEEKALVVFGEEPTLEAYIAKIDVSSLIQHQSNPILKKTIIGRKDVDIAAMIEKLGNIDWVKQGRHYYLKNEQVCPFCQQDTAESFAKSLEEYFDETFINDSNAIETLWKSYLAETNSIRQRMETLITNPSRFLDIDKIRICNELLDSKIIINLQLLEKKKAETSQVIDLEPLDSVLASVIEIIEAANGRIAAHNQIVNNLKAEQKALTSQVWRYVVDELKAELASYKTSHAALKKAIDALSVQITSKTTERATEEAGLRLLEKESTSIQPTIDDINGILTSFGFQGFSLAKSTDGLSYRLLRRNGESAKMTLSEGERTFVTFLYFYHLLKGSNSETGITNDRIVVFDDPVSSLDSDILFIVSSLIRKLFEEVKNSKATIKQIFILTHNVYFHKEVSFKVNSDKRSESFWVVRKSNETSRIEGHKSNPIRTSYDLLWVEVRKPDKTNLTIQNTLRRILENYFKILGRVDPDEICEMFVGNEKLICKSLFSWVNDGSHSIGDDIHYSNQGDDIEKYLKVFRQIFKESKHEAHYIMMMRDSYTEEEKETA
jgi:wobble nucleotide-excising tRNase